jgi:hypothetical protein
MLPESRQSHSEIEHNLLKISTVSNGLPIAIRQVPVMYRLPQFSASQEQQIPGKSNRQSSGPEKG